jgi:Kae1-associated kinase Bud32
MKTIYFGAEAQICLEGNKIIKKRIPKGYRHKEIDLEIRKRRTKHEARIMEKLRKAGLNVPKILEVTDFEIIMEYVEGEVLKNRLEKLSDDILHRLGAFIAKMHEQNIIHGDITPLNIILKEGELYLVDFGLSFHSDRIEDKAVDLHVLYEALKSSCSNYKIVWAQILEGYKKGVKNFEEIEKRLEEIERRGRYKKVDHLS